MAWNPSLDKLKEVLIFLYPTKDAAARVADEAGLPLPHVDLSGPAVTVWHNILEEAERRGLVQQLVQRVQAEYPENKELTQAAALYHPDMSATEGKEETPADNPQAGGNVTVGDVGGGAFVVGSGARIENVQGSAIGSGNFIQIGVLRIPVYLAVIIAVGVLILIVIGLFAARANFVTAQNSGKAVAILSTPPTATPTIVPTPTPTPVKMTGAFNIAVTDFGEISSDHRLHTSATGHKLSRVVFNALTAAYAENPASAFGDAGNVLIWHDSQTDTNRNIPLGIVPGDDPAARDLAAKELAVQIGANMVVYGQLDTADDPSSLQLEFYYNFSHLRAQPDAITGDYPVGPPLDFPTSPKVDVDAAVLSINEPLALRTKILFWLSVGLAYDVVGQTEKSLATFQQADQLLAQAEGSGSGGQGGGQILNEEILHYFIGREALSLRRYDVAVQSFDKAKESNPNYAKAYLGLGGVAFDRAQLFFVKDQPLSQGPDQCVSETNLSAADATLPEAVHDIDDAIRYYQQAIQLAEDSPAVPDKQIARLSLGFGYRLRGQADLFQKQDDQAITAFDQALQQIEQTVKPFANGNQVQLLAFSYAGLGMTYHSKANLSIRKDQHDSAVGALTSALKYYQACIDLGDNPQADFFVRELIRCTCRPYEKEIQKSLIQAGGGAG